MGWSDSMEEEVGQLKTAIGYLFHLQIKGKRIRLGRVDVSYRHYVYDVCGTVAGVSGLTVTVKLDEPTQTQSYYRDTAPITVEEVEVDLPSAIDWLEDK